MKENEDVAGFIVAEPICSNAVAKGIGEIEFMSSAMWENHPCCVAAFRNEIIEEHEDAIYEFTSLLVESGKFIERNKEKASEIAVAFLDPEYDPDKASEKDLANAVKKAGYGVG